MDRSRLAGLVLLRRKDCQAEERQRQQAVADRRTQQLLLDFERQRALQAEQTRIQVKEQRLFEQAVTPRQSFLLGQAN